MQHFIQYVILVISLILCGLGSGSAHSRECRVYTPEQKWVLFNAYTFAQNTPFSLTLPAIVQQESFWGSLIIRNNPQDISPRYKHQKTKPQGSYGVTHILASTAMALRGLNPSDWRDVIKARAKLLPSLIANDDEAFQMSLENLSFLQRHFFGNGRPLTKEDWRLLWSGWNSLTAGANSHYALAIKNNVSEFIRCGVFKDIPPLDP